MDFGQKSAENLQSPMNTFGTMIDETQEYNKIGQCKVLHQKAIPYFGVYGRVSLTFKRLLGYDYQWIYPTAIFKCNASNYDQYMDISQSMPANIQTQLEEFSKQYDFMSVHKHVNFYILNFNAKHFKQQFLVDKNQKSIRVNFAPHAYLYQFAKQGQEIKQNVLVSMFVSQQGKFIHSSIRGIDDCTDFGRIPINVGNLFNKQNLMEVHLHSSDDNHMAISPNNGAFLLNLTMPVVNFYIALCTLKEQGSSIHNLSIFNITIVNDDSLRITRELDTALNTQKIFTYTPVRSQIQQQQLKLKLPAMYLNILKKSSARINKMIENYFSFFLQSFKESKDREQLVKQLFLKLFSDKGDDEENQFIDAYDETIAQSYVEIFYKFIWFKMKMPDLKEFGTNFYKEYGDIEWEYSVHLLFKFMKFLQSQYTDIYLQHSALMKQFVKNEDTQFVEENIDDITYQSMSFEVEVEEEKDSDNPKQSPIKIKVNSKPLEEIEMQNDFFQHFPKIVNFPDTLNYNNMLEALFCGNPELIKEHFNKLKKVLQDYILYEVWKEKGSIHGIHNDFGRHSFFQSDEIPNYYHQNDEDRINLILTIQDKLSNL